MYLFPGPWPKKGLSSNGFTKTVTVRLRSTVPKRPTAHGLLRCALSQKTWTSVLQEEQGVRNS